MGVGPVAVDSVSKGLQKGLKFLAARVKALQRAVRVDNFRLAQRMRMRLAPYLRHLQGPLRNDVERLVRVSGLWVRNVGDRHQTKRYLQRIIREITRRLNLPQPLLAAEVSRLYLERLSGAPNK
jgi:hypothetical protein